MTLYDLSEMQFRVNEDIRRMTEEVKFYIRKEPTHTISFDDDYNPWLEYADGKSDNTNVAYAQKLSLDANDRLVIETTNCVVVEESFMCNRHAVLSEMLLNIIRKNNHNNNL